MQKWEEMGFLRNFIPSTQMFDLFGYIYNVDSTSLTITAIAHPITVHSTPSLSKDVVVIIVHDPLIATTVHEGGTHAET